MADKPFLGNPPPHIWRPSFVQLAVDLLEVLLCVPESTSIMSKMKVVRNIPQTQLHVINVDDKAPLEFRRCTCATAVVFCFSIANESSFENIKKKVD